MAKSYHHKDLPRQLLQAGKEYLAEHGHQSISIRVLAGKIGVSPGAPYHHFPDRRAFLLALAAEGYSELQRKAVKRIDAKDDPSEMLFDLGIAFIDFASRSPRLFELMYESELTTPLMDPAVAAMQAQGSQLLDKVVARVMDNQPKATWQLHALSFWCTLYGFVSLSNKHIIKYVEPDGQEHDEVAKAVVRGAVNAILQAAKNTS